MITLTPSYARLLIDRDQPFEQVTESVRTIFQICRVNKLRAAIVVSEQEPFDWRSSLRVAIRFVATRWDVPEIKLGLVALKADETIRDDVCKAATEAGFDCQVFDEEAAAVEWAAWGGGKE